MKKLLILIILNFILPLTLNAEDSVNGKNQIPHVIDEPQKSFEIEQLKERIKRLEQDIEYKTATKSDNGYIYNIDQIYANSLRYYEKTIEYIQWLVVIIGFLFLSMLGYAQWDNEKKFKTFKEFIKGETEKIEAEFNKNITENKKEIVAIKETVLKYRDEAEFNSRFSNAMSKVSAREKIRELKKLINRNFNVDHHPIYFQVANQFKILEEYREAKINYDKALKLCPEDKKAYMDRGIVKEKLGHYNDALDDYNNAIKIDSIYNDAYMNRGVVNERLDHFKDALNDYDYVIKLDPNYKKAYVNRAIVKEKIVDDKIVAYKRKLEHYKDALADYEILFCLDKNFFDGYIARARLFYKLKEYQKALNDSREAIKLNYNCEKSHRARGKAFLGINQYEDALRDLTKCLKINSEINFHIKIEFKIYIEFSKYLKNLKNKNDFEQEIYERVIAKNGFIITE